MNKYLGQNMKHLLWWIDDHFPKTVVLKAFLHPEIICYSWVKKIRYWPERTYSKLESKMENFFLSVECFLIFWFLLLDDAVPTFSSEDAVPNEPRLLSILKKEVSTSLRTGLNIVRLWPFKPWEWLASNFSLQYHPWITH